MTYSVRQIAERFHVGEHTVLAWIRLGELAAVDVSRTLGGKPRWRITAESLQTFELLRSALACLHRTKRVSTVAVTKGNNRTYDAIKLGGNNGN